MDKDLVISFQLHYKPDTQLNIQEWNIVELIFNI